MRKLILALGLHQGPLLMLLDEPTNYLNHRSQEALARVLADYRGALVIASHDHRFLSETTDAEWALGCR